MDDQPGLFDLPEPERPASPARTARGRARERFARRVVVDAVVVDAAALRAGALHTLDHTITISEGGAFDDEDDDVLTPEEEIAAGVAAALQWCVEPTDGMRPLVETGALLRRGLAVGGGPLRADDQPVTGSSWESSPESPTVSRHTAATCCTPSKTPTSPRTMNPEVSMSSSNTC